MPRITKPLDIVEYEVMNLSSGNTIEYCDDWRDVLEMAVDYRANPDIVFIGIDRHGRQAQTWTLADVDSGTFEREVT